MRLYNDRFNNLVPRHFSGDHLQLPGASGTIQLRAHEKRVVWRIAEHQSTIIRSRRSIEDLEQDLALREPTKAEAFAMEVGGRRHTDRKAAGAAVLAALRAHRPAGEEGTWVLGSIGGFSLIAEGRRLARDFDLALLLDRTNRQQEVALEGDLTALGLVARLEYHLGRFEVELGELRRRLAEAELQLPAYQARLAERFEFQDELEAKRREMMDLEAALAATQGEPDALAA